MCQAVHAAHEAGIHLADKNSDISSVVICSIPDEQGLIQAADRLASHGIRTTIFREPDLENQMTAIATEPLVKPARKIMSKYSLWRAEYATQ